MSFEWDETKRARNIAKHGVDFASASLIFDGKTVEGSDGRRDYGERRLAAYGQVLGAVLFVIYTWRSGRRRLISARRAGIHEREAYFKIIADEGESNAGPPDV